MPTTMEDVLRSRGRFAVDAPTLRIGRLALLVVLAGACYGFVMGLLGGRLLGGLYSGSKLPLLVLGATALCVPSFYVLNALLGLRKDFGAALRGILAAQGTVALCLASLAPVLAFFYVSGLAYSTALLLNGALFGSAVLGGQCTLRRHYAPLIARDRKHRFALRVWALVYVFVSVKLGWILRPFVGDPALPLEFMRADQWMEDPYTNLFWAAVAFAWSALGLD